MAITPKLPIVMIPQSHLLSNNNPHHPIRITTTTKWALNSSPSIKSPGDTRKKEREKKRKGGDFGH